MMTKFEDENLGTPDIKIAGLQIWIHGYQFAEADNEDDANWLRVSAHCGAIGASVWVSGSLIMVNDIERLSSGSEKLYQNQIKELEIDPLEPELHIALKTIDSRGHLELTVEITPDNLSQEHSFQFEIDQSYLPPLISQCRKILERFPYRKP
jgi:hypothetical protein